METNSETQVPVDTSMVGSAITIGSGVLILVLVILFITLLMRLYKRSTKETAFVRTGFGGQKVIKDGGAIIMPVLHSTLAVNMQTLRLFVSRKERESLITKDRLRVDVEASFFVRVKPDAESIAIAAQTLGSRTQDPTALKSATEDKFVDALRSVAAKMNLSELHENRAEFVAKVQATVAEDLSKNGLELESVSLTSLDQTNVKYFDPNNSFDAEGLTALTKVTQERTRDRNNIERTTQVAIEQRNLEATRETLTIQQQTEAAKLEQQRLIETQRAEQEAQLVEQRAARKRQADLATINAELETNKVRIEAERTSQELEIEKTRRVESAQILKDREIEAARIEREKQIQIARQEQAIAVAAKSEDESRARAAADLERANAVRASESVKTVEATAIAERSKQIAIIQAQEEVEREATRIRILSQAELDAADAQAQAKIRLAEAAGREYEIEAAGKQALNEAANTLSAEQIALRIKEQLIAQMPKILEQIAAPMTAVDSVKIIQMPGMTGGGNGDVTNSSVGNAADQYTNAMLNYRLRVPLVDELARTVGVDVSNGLANIPSALSPEVVGAIATLNSTTPEKKETVKKPVPAFTEDDIRQAKKLAGLGT